MLHLEQNMKPDEQNKRSFTLSLQWKSTEIDNKKQSDSLSPLPRGKGGKSGQHRALHFLTESRLRRWSNAEENNRP